MNYLVVRNELEDIVAVVSDVPDFVDGRALAASLVPEFESAYRVKEKPNYSDILRYDDVKSAKFKVSIEDSEEGTIVALSIDGRTRRYKEVDFRKLVDTLSLVVKRLDELHEGNF